MNIIPGNECARCGDTRLALMGSYFDLSLICYRCRDLEQHHPEYLEAKEAAQEAAQAGNYNHPGPGVPSGLKAACIEARRKEEQKYTHSNNKNT